MTRTIKASSIVLKAHPVGENHRGLVMLVREEGLVRPLAFGAQGRRSALRASAVPYNRGIANLHFDGAKNSWRLTAFDTENTHDGLRENLDRFYAASSWAEILLVSHGGGHDSEDVFDLASTALALMSEARGKCIMELRSAFLWNFLTLEGVAPDLSRCGVCGRKTPDNLYYYSRGLLSCSGCLVDRRQMFPEMAREWLLRLSFGRTPAECMGTEIPEVILKEVENWLLLLVQNLLERPLRSRKNLY